MSWGTIFFDPEVENWMESLSTSELATVTRQLERLEELGPHIPYPFSSQLEGKLRELRFHLQQGQFRISYFISSQRRIVLLTVFRKTKRKETREVKRAIRRMKEYS